VCGVVVVVVVAEGKLATKAMKVCLTNTYARCALHHAMGVQNLELYCGN